MIDLANALDADGAFAGVLGGRRLHVRDYASGEKVLMDRGSELRRRILELSPDVYAFEMEGRSRTEVPSRPFDQVHTTSRSVL